ncbi:MAG: permease prefix domain 1-containing protein [Planctomycetota bacterium]|nr:permease prefix domain 1-containing protein [Planctomycetota bacterium]
MSSDTPHDAALPPPGDSESVAARIDAEIADHLAMASHELIRRGEKPESAVQLAMSRFGDIGSIKRRCRWIQQGDEIMFRTVGIALMACLVLAMGALAWSSWSQQQMFSQQTESLTAQIASLTKTQQTMLDRQQPPEITGKVYLGDPSVPAKGVELTVWRFADEPVEEFKRNGSVYRLVQSDEQGNFRTGALPTGTYSLLAPIQVPAGKSEEDLYFKQLQSRPMYLVSGEDQPRVDLDLLASAQLRMELAKDFPAKLRDGADEFTPTVVVKIGDVEIDNDFPIPPEKYSIAADLTLAGPFSRSLAIERDSQSTWMLPAGRYKAALQVASRDIASYPGSAHSLVPYTIEYFTFKPASQTKVTFDITPADILNQRIVEYNKSLHPEKDIRIEFALNTLGIDLHNSPYAKEALQRYLNFYNENFKPRLTTTVTPIKP